MGNFESIEAGDRSARVYVAGERTAGEGVIVLHPWWGLNDDVLAFADRLAGEGFLVMASDLFDGQVASEVDDADRLSGSSDDAVCEAITTATIDRLAERLDADAPITALGFSFGAAWAVWAPTVRERVRATVVYYGTYTGGILRRASVPVLGHFAEVDPYEPAEMVDEFEHGLRDAGRDATIHRYPGTGHWFAEPSRDAYRREAADLAFERTVSFLRDRAAVPSA